MHSTLLEAISEHPCRGACVRLRAYQPIARVIQFAAAPLPRMETSANTLHLREECKAISGGNSLRLDARIADRPGERSNRVLVEVMPCNVESPDALAVLPQPNVGENVIRFEIPVHRACDLQVVRPLGVLEFKRVAVGLQEV